MIRLPLRGQVTEIPLENGRFWTPVGRCSIQLDAEGAKEFERLGRQSARDKARELHKMVGESARLHLGNWVAREDQIVITPEKRAFRSSLGERHARATGAS